MTSAGFWAHTWSWQGSGAGKQDGLAKVHEPILVDDTALASDGTQNDYCATPVGLADLEDGDRQEFALGVEGPLRWAAQARYSIRSSGIRPIEGSHAVEIDVPKFVRAISDSQLKPAARCSCGHSGPVGNALHWRPVTRRHVDNVEAVPGEPRLHERNASGRHTEETLPGDRRQRPTDGCRQTIQARPLNTGRSRSRRRKP